MSTTRHTLTNLTHTTLQEDGSGVEQNSLVAGLSVNALMLQLPISERGVSFQATPTHNLRGSQYTLCPVTCFAFLRQIRLLLPYTDLNLKGSLHSSLYDPHFCLTHTAQMSGRPNNKYTAPKKLHLSRRLSLPQCYIADLYVFAASTPNFHKPEQFSIIFFF